MTSKYIFLNTNSTLTIIDYQKINGSLTYIESLVVNNFPVALYCSQCSGICFKLESSQIMQCFHCQHKYQIPSNSESLIQSQKKNLQDNIFCLMPPLPKYIINCVRQQNLLDFNQANLLKTLAKENYRRLYEFLTRTIKDSGVPHSLIDFVYEFAQIVNARHFSDGELKILNNKYAMLLKFSLDAYHLI